MDAAAESTVISGFLGSDRASQGKRTPPSSEGSAVQIVAIKPNRETVC